MNALDVVYDVGRWSIEGLWVPLLAWTAVALPLYLIVRHVDSISPHIRYHTSMAILFSLPLGLLGAALFAFDAAPIREVVAVVVLPPIEAVSAASSTVVWSPYHTAGIAVVFATFLSLWKGSSLLVALHYLSRYRSQSENEAPSWVRDAANAMSQQLKLDRPVRIAVSGDAPAPLTFGWKAPLVVLPASLLGSRDDVQLALLHELIHIRRRDYLFQWAEQFLGAVFSLHPLLGLLRRETSILREITCDAEVVVHTGDRSRYARLLYRFSTPAGSPWSAAVGILQEENHLKKRIIAMKNMLDFKGMKRSKRTAVGLSAALLAITVLAVACSDALVQPTAEPDEAPVVAEAAADAETFVIVEDMPELVGGLASIQQHVVYPKEAKDAGVEGRVIVQFIVDETGAVQNPTIVRGVGSGIDEAALAAVRQAEFVPGRQDGEAVRVKMSLPITFKLGAEKAQQSGAPPVHKLPDGGAVNDVIKIEIGKAGNILLNGKPIELDQLPSSIQRAGITESTVVSVRVDPEAPASLISEVQSKLRESTRAKRIHYGVK